MPHVKFVEHIDAPPEAVWAFISDLDRAPEWVTVMEELVSVSDDPIREGSTYRELSQIGPSLSETEWAITRFDAPHVQVHETEGSEMAAVLAMRTEANEGGTRFIYTVDYHLMPGFRPLGWLLETLFARRMMEQNLRQTVANVKRMVEAENDQSA